MSGSERAGHYPGQQPPSQVFENYLATFQHPIESGRSPYLTILGKRTLDLIAPECLAAWSSGHAVGQFWCENEDLTQFSRHNSHTEINP